MSWQYDISPDYFQIKPDEFYEWVPMKDVRYDSPELPPQESRYEAPPIIPDPDEWEEDDPYTLEFDGEHVGPPIYAPSDGDEPYVNPDSRAADGIGGESAWRSPAEVRGVLRPFEGYPESFEEPEVIEAESTPRLDVLPIRTSYPIKDCEGCNAG